MNRLLLALGLAFLLVVAWLLLRREPPVPAPAPTPSVEPVTSDRPAPPPRPLLTRSPRSSDRPEPNQDDLPAPDIEFLRLERLALHRELVAETNALLEAVSATLSSLGITDPATVATAWTLANNWGILAKAESSAERQIDDQEMRDELSKTRRRVLVDSFERELQGFLERPVPDELRSRLESLGRDTMETARVRKPMTEASEKEADAARRRAASSGEEPLP